MRDPDRGDAIPAVALTAYASAQDRERAWSAGFIATSPSRSSRRSSWAW